MEQESTQIKPATSELISEEKNQCAIYLCGKPLTNKKKLMISLICVQTKDAVIQNIFVTKLGKQTSLAGDVRPLFR